MPLEAGGADELFEYLRVRIKEAGLGWVTDSLVEDPDFEQLDGGERLILYLELLERSLALISSATVSGTAQRMDALVGADDAGVETILLATANGGFEDNLFDDVLVIDLARALPDLGDETRELNSLVVQLREELGPDQGDPGPDHNDVDDG